MSSRTSRQRGAAALLVAALLQTACATEWERVDGPTTTAGSEREPLHAVLMPPAGPDDHVSPPVEHEDQIVEGRWRHVGGPFQRPTATRVAEAVPEARQPAASAPRIQPSQPAPRRTTPRLAIPAPARVRKTTPPPAARTPRGAPQVPEAPPDARTHYLRNPTTIEARAITLRVPREWLGEVRGEGGTRTEGPRGAWRLTGKGTVRLRELTLRGARLTVIPVTKPDAPLSIMAKGAVDMVSRVGDRAVREEGANMIMITNARMVPLR